MSESIKYKVWTSGWQVALKTMPELQKGLLNEIKVRKYKTLLA